MPRDGSGIYVKPFPDVVEGTTIESTVHNGEISDIELDLNTPRPIVAGGTGANNAHDAMIALSGEIAKQGPVTNFDSFAFMPGSFYSAAGATSAPVADHAFTGICYSYVDPAYMVIEARDLFEASPGHRYVRQKTAGVWGAWAQQAGSTADLDAAYVNVTGDAMSGNLQITRAAGMALYVQGKENAPSLAPTDAYAFFSSANGGYGALSIGGRPASPYSAWLQSNNSAGTALPLEINPVAGEVMIGSAGSAITVKGSITANAVLPHMIGTIGGLNADFNPMTTANASIVTYGGGANWAGYGADGNGALWFRTGTSGTPLSTLILHNDQTVRIPSAAASTSPTTGALTVAGGVGIGGNINVNAIAATGGVTAQGITSTAHLMAQNGYVYLNAAATKYFGYDGSNFNFTGGSLIVNGNGMTVGGTATVNGTVQATGYNTRPGISGGLGSNAFNLFYPGVQLWIDNTNVGNIAIASDYRIKKDIIDLPGMWETVKALRPIKYTQAQFTPPSHVKFVAGEVLKARKEAEGNPDAKPREVNTGPLVEADDIERWGFIAHELQATLTPSAASGEKDSPDTIQSPNPFTVIAALTKALQEAMVRIEALEAR